MDRFCLAALDFPLIAAPMAGGPTTPDLVAAAANFGGLGFIAGGLLTIEDLAADVVAVRERTPGPLGVNLFVPQSASGTADQLQTYALMLAAEARHYGVRLGDPLHGDDDWQMKLDVVHDLRPEVVSFTFGLPTAEDCRSLQSAGIAVVANVTSVDEAQLAVACGAEILVVQGPAAGGHRATFDPARQPTDEPLDELLAAVMSRFHDVPIVAAGGLSTSRHINRVLRAGAAAAQCGTAFLLADEAGTNAVHRAALCSREFRVTVVTRAFTGRYARSLRNRFIDDYDWAAPCGFPEVARLTGPIQAAAVLAHDPHATSLWAGTEWRDATPAPAAHIMDELLA